MTGLGTDGVDMVARFWIDPPRRREAVDALDGAIEAVKVALTEAGLDLPFPTTQVLFHDQTEETDGDRARQREGWPSKGRAVPRPRWQAQRPRPLTDRRRAAGHQRAAAQAKRPRGGASVRSRLSSWLESLGDVFWLRPALLVVLGVVIGEGDGVG